MRKTALPALLVSALLASACFSDVEPGDTAADATTGDTGDGDGDGDPGDGDGEPGDGDGEPGDGDGEPGDGDGEPGDGDGDAGCQPGECASGEYCIAGVCEQAPDGMVAIEAGTFWMGCNEAIDIDCDPNEYPYHEVMLSAYAIDRTEVTAAAYAACVADGECIAPCVNSNAEEPDLPVTCVSWFDARDYCTWAGKQLPTEAQWEKAARGDDGRLFPWGNQPPNCNLMLAMGCPGELGPVGSYPAGASPYGVLDMSGSLIEWTADWYSPSYYVESPTQDPTGPANGTERVIRSGLIGQAPADLRVSLRGGYNPTSSSFMTIRCAYNPQ